MAYKLIWSPAARDDLHDIVLFIVRDNPDRAMTFGYELISDWFPSFKTDRSPLAFTNLLFGLDEL